MKVLLMGMAIGAAAMAAVGIIAKKIIDADCDCYDDYDWDEEDDESCYECEDPDRDYGDDDYPFPPMSEE